MFESKSSPRGSGQLLLDSEGAHGEFKGVQMVPSVQRSGSEGTEVSRLGGFKGFLLFLFIWCFKQR